MNLIAIIKARKIESWLLLIAGVNLIIIWLSGWPVPGGDSASYLDAGRFIKEGGLEGIDLGGVYNRLLTAPMMLMSMAYLSYLLGGLYKAMITINIGFYFLTTLFFYWLAKEVLEKKVAAGLATVLVITNYALINFGIAYLTDMGGWFFFIATSYLAVRYFKYENKKDYWGVILLAIVGFLFKEYGGLGMITLITLISLTNKIKREKIIEILKAIIIFGLAVGVYYLIFYLKFNYTYWSWYVFNLDYYAFNSSLAETYSLTLIIKVLGWLYSIGWLWLIWRWWEIKNLDKKTKIILGGMLPASLMWLIWPALTQRIAFILVPWLAIVSGWILYRFKSKWMAGGVVLLYILINYNIQTLMEVINIPWLGN